MLAAETNILQQAQDAANQANTDAANVRTLITQVTQLIQIVQTGPVISDITGLTDALLQKASVDALNSGLSGKQPISALLTTFAALAGAADKFPYFTGVGAMALAAVTVFARTVLAAPDAPTMRFNLGLGDAATHPASDFATPASVASQVVPIIQGTAIYTSQIAPIFDDQVSTVFNFVPNDWGAIVTLTNAAPITANLPANIIKGWNVLVYQGGAGQVTFAPASGVTLRNRQNQFKTAGQYAMVSLLCVANTTGSNPVFVLGGDTA
jgi:hypothetical protein